MVDREKVIEALNCRAYDDDFPCSICAYYRPDEKPVAKCDYRGLMDDAIALLKEQPEIIRCYACKHGEKTNDVYLCGKSRGFGLAHEPDWFCADGEMKKND